MLKFLIPLATACLLSACAGDAMSTDQVSHLNADCGNVQQQISMLENEKAAHSNRMAAGVTSVLPVTALAQLVSGTYETNTQIASGEWAEKVDMKLTELKALQSQCTTGSQG